MEFQNLSMEFQNLSMEFQNFLQEILEFCRKFQIFLQGILEFSVGILNFSVGILEFFFSSLWGQISSACQFRAWHEKKKKGGVSPLNPLSLGNSRIFQGILEFFVGILNSLEFFVGNSKRLLPLLCSLAMTQGILEFLRIFMSVQPFSSLALINSLIALVFISSRQRLFLLPLQPSQEQGTHSQLA